VTAHVVPAQSDSPRVLVVDDEAVTRAIAVRLIAKSGMRVQEATDGEGALAAFSMARYDIVLLDVMMPGIDGFEVCRRVRETDSTTSVLIMTALEDSDSIDRAYDSGATDFITKPINWSILPHRLRYMLRASRNEQALRRQNAELARINDELQQTRTQLLQSEKMASIGQLAAGVAHEINNPIGYVSSNLGSLDGYLKQLFEVIDTYRGAESEIAGSAARERIAEAKAAVDLEFLSEDVFALLQESREGISRVSKIVQDLKDFSRV
jgi:two-component system NtrC family sensor kinase